MKIISAGFPKTGTKSASEALRSGFSIEFITVIVVNKIILKPFEEFSATMFVMSLIPHIVELRKTGLISLMVIVL